MREVSHYEIWDTLTQSRIGKAYDKREPATRRADKLSNEYGSYRYNVRTVWKSE